MELQQSIPYAEYVKSLNWTVEIVDGLQMFVRRFPFVGGFAKLQRIDHLPSIRSLQPVLKKYAVRRLVLEFSPLIEQSIIDEGVPGIRSLVPLVQSPYIPTKTILVDLLPSSEDIFHRFSEAKRRAVRRAVKYHVIVQESDSIDMLIKAKNRSAGMFGFITTSGAKQMWNAFRPHNATTVIATTETGELLGGVFLIFWEKTAYYWIAGATKKGKKLFAPTLLVWKAIEVAKQHGMEVFDFLGVWDERYPNDNTDWHGFTKFKEGFGGTTLYYPTHKTSGS